MILFHPLIFAVYPIIFLYALNVRETPPSDIILPIILALLLCLSFFLIVKILFKDVHKTGFLTSVFLILFFSYGHLFDFLRTTPLDKIINGKQFFAYSFYVLVFLAVVYITWKSRKSFLRLTKILNITSSILILIPLLMIAIFFVRNYYVKLPTAEISSGEQFDKGKIQNEESLPDIYYIILDRYASNNNLRKMFKYENSDFLSFLKEKGFYVASDAQANYIDTIHSLASSLNMTHLTFLSSLGEQSYNDWNLLNEKVSNNEVLRILKSLGYKTIQFGSWWAQSRVNRFADVNINIDTEPGFHSLVLSKTMLHPIRVMLGLQADFLQEQFQRELMKFKELKKVASQKGPKFVFVHFLITHEPFVFRENGSFLDEESQRYMTREEKYIKSVKFTNQKIMEFVEAALPGKDNYNPIIIIQADEGPFPDRINDNHQDFDWNSASDEEIAEKMGILNAYYFPDGGDKLLYSTISPVNTFRIVFNYYFGQDFKLLGDDSFLSNVNQPYVFIPIKK